jgi:Response regulator of the LytR/AlgR family
MKTLTALIVDDEPAARRDLLEVLASIGQVDVVAQASDAAAAQLLARRHRPNLVFLDIQLPGANGFAALEGIDASRSCVIFTTAYAQFALRAFEVGATDYLLKPVEEERCRRAIERAREILQRAQGETPSGTLEIEERGRHVRVAMDSVRLLKAEGNYLEVVHDQGRGLVRRTLEGLLADLPAGQLVRLNRHQAVDPSTVQAWSGSGQRGLRLVLRDGTELSVSRRRSTEVVNRIRRTATMRVK